MNARSAISPAVLMGLSFLFAPAAMSQPGKAKGGSLPLEGRPLPEVSGFDEAGEPFSLRQRLKGRHGVIVFGCLT